MRERVRDKERKWSIGCVDVSIGSDFRSWESRRWQPKRHRDIHRKLHRNTHKYTPTQHNSKNTHTHIQTHIQMACLLALVGWSNSRDKVGKRQQEPMVATGK